MTIHRIRLLGDPILRAKCEPITKPRSTAVRVIMDDMRETLRDWQSRFGSGRAIAAPQIGAPVRMVYVEMDQPWTLINPEIIDIGNEDFEVWDDCFSFPNLLVRVSRAYRIRVRYQDLKGEWNEIEVEGDRAELLQHEIDHLDGVLAVDRPAGPRPFLPARGVAPASRAQRAGMDRRSPGPRPTPASSDVQNHLPSRTNTASLPPSVSPYSNRTGPTGVSAPRPARTPASQPSEARRPPPKAERPVASSILPTNGPFRA